MMRIRRSLTNFFKNVLFLVKIEGESGWPILIPGKTYYATNILRPRIGDFAVFRNPKNQNEIFVKKVTAIRKNGHRVKSAVSWGTSSNDFGVVLSQSILGVVLHGRKN